MPTYRYLPMLRSKAGEATALTNLTSASKDRMMPIIHLVHVPSPTYGEVVAKAWAGRVIALDGTFQSSVIGTATGFTHVFGQLGKGSAKVIPVVEYDADPAYLSVVKKAMGTFAPGVVVKVKPNRLKDVTIWIASQGWSPSQVDLVVTLMEIAGYDPDMVASIAIKTISDHVPTPSPWRSITLSSSAAPKDMGVMTPGRNNVPRYEWKVWKDVVSSLPFVDYSDFSTLTPELTDPPGYVMAKATVSVRYAVDDYWIVLKGKATTGKSGLAMTPQYRSHAKILQSDPEFNGLVGCWGDDRIEKIAKGTLSAGGRPQWAAYVASRHLSLIADRLP